MNQSKPRKRDVTRKTVIQAAIECIYQEGFHAAHTNKIAEQAGVSWGVLQYHFGDKDSLLQAVIDHIFAEFSATLGAVQFNDLDLHARVRHLIDVIWSLVNKKEYRVSIAILRNAGKSTESSIDGQKQVIAWAKETSTLWDALFEDTQPQQSEVARHLLFAALRGLADEINPKGNITNKNIEDERAALADAITYILSKK